MHVIAIAGEMKPEFFFLEWEELLAQPSPPLLPPRGALFKLCTIGINFKSQVHLVFVFTRLVSRLLVCFPSLPAWDWPAIVSTRTKHSRCD